MMAHSKPTILLADDNPDYFKVLSDLFLPFCTVFAVNSGEGALRVDGLDPRPDLIFVGHKDARARRYWHVEQTMRQPAHLRYSSDFCDRAIEVCERATRPRARRCRLNQQAHPTDAGAVQCARPVGGQAGPRLDERPKRSARSRGQLAHGPERSDLIGHYPRIGPPPAHLGLCATVGAAATDAPAVCAPTDQPLHLLAHSARCMTLARSAFRTIFCSTHN